MTLRYIFIIGIIFLVSCSEENTSRDFILVEIEDETANLLTGDPYHLMAEISTPNALRSISLYIGSGSIVFNGDNVTHKIEGNFQSPQKHILDTVLRFVSNLSKVNIEVRAEDHVGNYTDKVVVNFAPFQYPTECEQSNCNTILVFLPLTTPVNDNVYMHGGFNSNQFGDNNFKLSSIEGANKCSCICVPFAESITAQFNRGSEATINKGNNCNDNFFGFSTQVNEHPIPILLEQWLDIDCN